MRVLEITGKSTSEKDGTLSITAKGVISGKQENENGYFIANLTECSVTVDGESVINIDKLYLAEEDTTDLTKIYYHDGKDYNQLGGMIKYWESSDFRVSNTEVSGESEKIIETLQESINKMGDAYKAAFNYIATGDTVKARKVLRSMIPAINALYNVTLDGWNLV